MNPWLSFFIGAGTMLLLEFLTLTALFIYFYARGIRKALKGKTPATHPLFNDK